MNKNRKLTLLLSLLFAVTLGTVALAYFYNPDAAKSRALSRRIQLKKKQQERLGDAFAEFSTGHYSEAEEKLDSILDFAPESVPAWSLLGLVYYNSGRYDQAVSAYRKVLVYAPFDASTYNNLAMAQLALGNYSAAEKNLKKSAELNPGEGRVHVNLARVYYAQNRDGETLAHLASARRTLGERFKLYVSKSMFERLNSSQEFLALFTPAKTAEVK